MSIEQAIREAMHAHVFKTYIAPYQLPIVIKPKK